MLLGSKSNVKEASTLLEGRSKIEEACTLLLNSESEVANAFVVVEGISVSVENATSDGAEKAALENIMLLAMISLDD